MDMSELEQVLKFLRENGFSNAESALMKDVIEKISHLGPSGFEKLLFPMVPSPPPLKIPTTRRPADQVASTDDCSSNSNSQDEFVSLDSYTAKLCSSEFSNPYGVRTTTRTSSRASSDRMSQFGTARDYPDSEMQDDRYWYKQKDEDFLMHPMIRGPASSGDPNEDKFIMSVKTGNHSDPQVNSNYVAGGSQSKGGAEYLDFQSPISLVDRGFQHDGFLEEGGVGGGFSWDYVNALKDLKLTDDNDKEMKRANERQDPYNSHCLTTESNSPSCTNGSSSISDLNDCLPNENYSFEDYTRSVGITIESDSEACEKRSVTFDDLPMYDINENDDEVFHLRVIHRKNRTGLEENKDLPIILNQVIAGRYHVVEYLASSSFSKAVQAHDLHTGMDVCLKIVKNDKDSFDQRLDEIKMLKFVNKNDPGNKYHILSLYDYFYHQEHLFIVTELLRENLYEFQNFTRESGAEPYFTLTRLQVITVQCLEALEFLHGLGITHCDLKPENILMKSYQSCEIKVIDLGHSCFEADEMKLYLQSRSYRAPEVILGLPYDQKIDLWSLGCILSELCSGEVLFPNEGIVTILARVIGILGAMDMEMLFRGQETHKYFTRNYDLYHMNEETNKFEFIMPDESSLEDHLQISDPVFISFVKCLLQVNPERRPTAREALQHPWLRHSY